jgi:hypothetical protein
MWIKPQGQKQVKKVTGPELLALRTVDFEDGHLPQNRNMVPDRVWLVK